MARPFLALAIASLLPTAGAGAMTRSRRTNGNVITGQITGVSNGAVTVTTKTPNGGQATIPYQLSDIKSVVMAPPPELAEAKGQPPDVVVAKLAPLVKATPDLPADWVVDAMGQLADAYSDLKQDNQASAIYAQINQLYPGSAYTNIATAGQAKLLLAQGKVDEALATVQPVITAADKTVSPSAVRRAGLRRGLSGLWPDPRGAEEISRRARKLSSP